MVHDNFGIVEGLMTTVHVAWVLHFDRMGDGAAKKLVSKCNEQHRGYVDPVDAEGNPGGNSKTTCQVKSFHLFFWLSARSEDMWYPYLRTASIWQPHSQERMMFI